MSDTINPTKWATFYLAEIHGRVTGVVTDGAEIKGVFATAWDRAERPTERPGSMVYIELGRTVDAPNGLTWEGRAKAREVRSWRWITKADFDQLVNLDDVRKTLGWAAA